MKATDLLERQHREVKALFKRLEKNEGARTRSQLLDEIAKNLAAHMVIEQEIFYPACARVLEDKSIVAEAFEEHGIASMQLKRVLAVRGRDTTFEAKAKVLRDLVEHHIDEEEKELFKKIRREMDERQLEMLGTQMSRRFAQQLREGYQTVLSEPPPDAREALRGGARTTSNVTSMTAARTRRGATTQTRSAGTTRRKAARGTRMGSTGRGGRERSRRTRSR
jgi:hemerythrin-like domain-containing protein